MIIRRLLMSLLMCPLATTAIALASEKSYLVPITRHGKTTLRVAHSFWAGEYPRPIINVMANQPGYTTLEAYKSLRKLNEPVSCSIKNGLYHPWSKTPHSVTHFYTIGPRIEIKAAKTTQLDDHTVRKGQTISNIIGVGEGYCMGQVDGKEIDFFCDNVKPDAFIETIPSDEHYEQWLYVTCREGYQAFIQDTTLLKHKGVTEGQVESYGNIKP